MSIFTEGHRTQDRFGAVGRKTELVDLRGNPEVIVASTPSREWRELTESSFGTIVLKDYGAGGGQLYSDGPLGNVGVKRGRTSRTGVKGVVVRNRS